MLDLPLEEENEVELKESKDYTELIELALERFKKCEDAWKMIYEIVKEDTLFASGGKHQWDEGNMQARTRKGRSSHSYNLVGGNIRYVVNNAIANCPNIKVHPVSGNANKNTAKVLDGLIKHIQYKSNANAVYVNALKAAVTGGIGFFRILPKSEVIRGVEKVYLCVDKIKDPTTVYVDPDAESDDLSDMNYFFIKRSLSVDEFKKKYPNAQQSAIKDNAKSWYNKTEIRVAEYWTKDEMTNKVSQYIISGEEVLEANDEYPGSMLPLCIVVGEEVMIGEHRIFKGLVADVKDLQKYINYLNSEMIDYIAKGAKALWMASAKNIEGPLGKMWASSNIDDAAVLIYNEDNGNKPQKIDPLPPPTGLMTASQDSQNLLRAIVGIRDPLQDVPVSQSGKAIGLQIEQGNMGILHFMNNLSSAIKRLGEIALDLIPFYYDGPQILQILGSDGSILTTPVNQPYESEGEIVQHDLSLEGGEYSCTLSTGASYESRRAEALDKLLQMSEKNQQIQQVGGDLIVRNMDFEGAEELADRIKATIPPNILAASNSSNADTKPQVLQANLFQMQQQLQAIQQDSMMKSQALEQLHNTLEQLQAELKNKQTELELKKMELELNSQIKNQELGLRRLEMENTAALKNKELEFKYVSSNEINNVKLEDMDMEAEINKAVIGIITEPEMSQETLEF